MNKKDLSRNRYMLHGLLARNGYDWWWHSFTGYQRETGKPRVFFIEYYICNPGLGGNKVILGQLKENKAAGVKPSYGMIKAGTWGKDACQINNFYPVSAVSPGEGELNLQIGECTLTETHMKGYSRLTAEEAQENPAYMSDSGSMSWDVRINKKIAFHVGYGAAKFFRVINAFEMFWHAEGIQTEYSGEVIFNGEYYDIIPEKSYGYADKNWGKDFTSPWLWISSCNMKSLLTGKILSNSAVEFGGGRPKAFGLDLGRKLLGCLYYEGEDYEFNFSKFWTGARIEFKFQETDTVNIWKLIAKNRKSILKLVLKCPRDEMLFIKYEAPNGSKRHNRLWNGGTGYGEMKLYHRNGKENKLVDHIEFQSTGCEYGEYSEL